MNGPWMMLAAALLLGLTGVWLVTVVAGAGAGARTTTGETGIRTPLALSALVTTGAGGVSVWLACRLLIGQ